MSSSIFISHVYEDAASRDQVRSWAVRGLLGPNVVVTGESADVRQGGEAAIRAHLSPKLQGATAVLVLVGTDTHNHPWVEYESQHALSGHRRVIVVRIPGTRGAAPPPLRSSPEVPMDPSAIRRALENR
jgi:hypothetical protein